jgi:hypothetical protein
MELSGFEPLTSWVRWKARHLPGSGRKHLEGVWLLISGLGGYLDQSPPRVDFEPFGRGLDAASIAKRM